MIPILYESNETNFSHHGLGDLIDCTECTVTEERNGIYECEISYPIKGQHYSEISVDRIIKVKANETSNPQAFRIYRISKPINGIVKVYLQHISYDLNSNPVVPLELDNVNATTALTTILENCVFKEHNFKGQSDVSGTYTLYNGVPISARNYLGGNEGSILELYGGEYEFDNFTIKLHANRGQDNGVRIAYGKNLTDITADVKIDSLYTSIYPYVIDKDGKYHELTEKIVPLSNSDKFGSARTLILDLSGEFDKGDTITDSKIREKAKKYAVDNNINEISQNIEVSFVQLWQSKEYETFALLERIKLCDIVTIDYPALGVSAKAKVIKTEYDGLNEKFIKITLGEAKSNFSITLNKISSDIKTMQEFVRTQPSVMQQAIDHATELITGGLGGYVVITPDNNGYPQEILIMDKPVKEEAKYVWRFNQGGLGHSHTGYNGPFDDIALTKDGQINASMITAGELNADLIKAGTIQDKSGNVTINMNNGLIKTALPDGAKMEIWTNGISFYDVNSKVLASMFVSMAEKGVVTANSMLIGTRNSERTFIGVENNKGYVTTDGVWCDNIKVGTSTLSTHGNYLKSSNAYQSIGFSVADSSGTEAGAFYLNADGESVLRTNALFVDGNEYSPTTITIDGQTINVLARI